MKDDGRSKKYLCVTNGVAEIFLADSMKDAAERAMSFNTEEIREAMVLVIPRETGGDPTVFAASREFGEVKAWRYNAHI